MITRVRQLASLVCLFTIAATANAASVPLVSINPATDIAQNPGPGQFFGFDENYNNGSVGWSFSVTSPIVVTNVGWYDKDGDGLLFEHTVELWKSNGQLTPTYTQLINPNPGPPSSQGVTIPAGTTAPLGGSYRQSTVPGGPLTLDPGRYILGGTVIGSDPAFADVVRYGLDRGGPFSPHTMPTDPRIDLGAPYYNSPAFQVPNSFLLVDGVELGPMLFVVPVPEPTSIALISTAVFFIFARRARTHV